MSICANRTDPRGELRPCAGAGRRCVCGEQVATELAAQAEDVDTREAQ